MRVVVGVTGASGMIVAKRLLDNLAGHEVHLVVSNAARRVMAQELPGTTLSAAYQYDQSQIEAPISSSSFPADAVVIVPCTMKTLAAIAHGYSENLIVRSAENALKMRWKLIVAPRETPLSLAAIENMRSIALSGGVVLPLNAAYYFGPKTADDIADFFAGKILDVLGIEHTLYRRWSGFPISVDEE